MTTYRFRLIGNYPFKLTRKGNCEKKKFFFCEKYNFLLKLVCLLILCTLMVSCSTYQSTSALNNDSNATVISEITTYNTTLSKKDVGKYFCNNLTEYFNSYKYYKISSEIYHEKEKQKNISTSRITKQGNIYNVEYIGSAGRYIISFSNRRFLDADEIFTFRRRTVLGNAIRGKVYDTFSAWIMRKEIALKANNNSYLFIGELHVAVEVEKWYNSLSTVNE